MATVDITSSFEFVRTVLINAYGFFTDDFLKFGTLQFSIADVLIGFLLLGILLRLIYSRMHLASGVLPSAVDRSGVRSAQRNATPRVNVYNQTAFVGRIEKHFQSRRK